MGLISKLRFFSVALAGVAVSGVAHAHDGHGNTFWHAMLHMLENNGAVLLLALVLMVALLVLRARKQRDAVSMKSQSGSG